MSTTRKAKRQRKQREKDQKQHRQAKGYRELQGRLGEALVEIRGLATELQQARVQTVNAQVEARSWQKAAKQISRDRARVAAACPPLYWLLMKIADWRARK